MHSDERSNGRKPVLSPAKGGVANPAKGGVVNPAKGGILRPAKGLRTLLAEVIDYAGLFPPAKLDLDQAIRNYARYLSEPEAWMLGRFVCPASRLGELAPYVDELFSVGPALRLCVQGRGAATCKEFLEGTQSDVKDIAEFCARTEERTAIAAFEARLPGESSTEKAVAELLASVSELWHSSEALRRTGSLSTFYEPPPGVDWQESWPAIIRGIAQHGTVGWASPTTDRVGVVGNAHPTGFKLRCGGPDPSAQVSVEQVASAICWARAARVPLKLTAGMHHPLRHYDPEAHADVHGFINVFAAGVLAASGDVDQAQVCSILASQDAESFEFTEDAMFWQGNRVSCAGIAQARRDAVTSFGSCSFDDPRQDLRSLGLL